MFQRVHVEFTSLAVEADSACQYDHVDVFDGADSSAELLTRLCGTGLPGGITATGNTLLVGPPSLTPRPHTKAEQQDISL